MNIDLPGNESVPKYLEKFIVFFSSIRLSLRSKIILSFFTVILLLSTMNTVLVVCQR